MKRLVLIAAAAVCLLLSACERGAAAPARAGGNSLSQAGAAGDAQPDYQGLAGDYVFETEGVSKEHSPTLTLNADGSCRFTANLLERMGHMDGRYEVKENTVHITVEQVDFDGVVGADIKDLRFDIGGGGALLYRGTSEDEDQVVGLTNPYDLFQRADGDAASAP